MGIGEVFEFEKTGRIELEKAEHCKRCGCITDELSVDGLCARCCVEKFYPNGIKVNDNG